MRSRKPVIFLSATMAILFTSYIVLCRYEIPIPPQWQQIHRGQLRSEVLLQIPDLDAGLLDFKQIDQAHRFFESPVFRSVAQYLQVDYDDWRPQTARVFGIRIRTSTSRFGGLRSGGYVPKNADRR